MLRDEILSAYLDGELDAEQRAAIEAQLHEDKGAATRLDRMRTSDALLRQAFPATAQMKDDRLAAMILEPKARISSRMWTTRLAPLAAAVVFGVLLGQLPRMGTDQPAPFALSSQEARLLDTMPSGQTEQTPRGAFEVVLSVQTEAGPCREFRLSQAAQSTAVLACRDDGASWRMIAASAAPQADGYVPAGANSLLDAALAERGSATGLDEGEERALIEHGWR